VLGGSFDKDNYIEERVWATKDGTQVPISMVYKKGLIKMGKPIIALCLWFIWSFHGCYFSSTRLSLLDRGFVYAIAHIRGGEDLGRQWYEGGKLLKEKNTFKDFIACSTTS
jgi:oligopeptidase B